jgi:hypothetical protein
MNRVLQRILFALLLLCAQQAAQLHALSHLAHDLKLAQGDNSGKGVPPLNHPAEQCIAFHAVDTVIVAVALLLEPERIAPPSVAPDALPPDRSPRIVFDARAPPAFS